MTDIWENNDLTSLHGEIWKDIPGFEGIYQASSLGRIKSLERFIAHPRHGFYKRSARILKPKLNDSGYVVGTLQINKIREYWAWHRLVMLAFTGESDLSIDHINGIKTDNRPENLEYVTQRVNNNRYWEKNSQLPVGVYKEGKKYGTYITIKSQKLFLGLFDTIEEAASIRQNVLKDLDNIEKYVKKAPKSPFGTGIIKKKNRFEVSYHYKGKKHYIRGPFKTLEEAQEARKKTIEGLV